MRQGYKRATATSVDFMRVTPRAFSAVVVNGSPRQRAQRAKGLSCAAPQRSFAEVNAFLQVRFGPESRRERFVTACPLCANMRQNAPQQSIASLRARNDESSPVGGADCKTWAHAMRR